VGAEESSWFRNEDEILFAGEDIKGNLYSPFEGTAFKKAPRQRAGVAFSFEARKRKGKKGRLAASCGTNFQGTSKEQLEERS